MLELKVYATTALLAYFFKFFLCVFVLFLKITLTNLVSVNERLVYTPHPENPEK